MSERPWQDEIAGHTRTLQIIVGSLVTGCVVFGIVALVISSRGDAQRPDGQLLTYLAIGFAAIEFVAWLIVPAVIVGSNRKRIVNGTWEPPARGQNPVQWKELLDRTGDAGKLAVVFQTKTIVSAAIFEGAAFFAIIAYFVEGSFLSLALAAVLMILVALQFPTRSSHVQWIQEQLRLIEQERQFGPST